MRSPLTHRLGPKECDPCRYRHGCDPPEASNSPVGCSRACLPWYALLVRPSRRRQRNLTPVVQARLPWHLLILAWLIMWITTAFLFHLHIPDVTADWSSLHSGGAHTVFAPGLPGEFFHPSHDSRHGPSTHLSQRIVHSLELDLVLFDDDRKAKPLRSLAAPHSSSETVLLPAHCAHGLRHITSVISPKRSLPLVRLLRPGYRLQLNQDYRLCAYVDQISRR